MGDTLKIGLVGCGGRGTGAADNCLHAAPNVELIALADIFPEKLAACRKNLGDPDREGGALPGVKVADDHCFTGLDAYEKILKTDIDLVLLATPPGFRPLHFEAAVAAGKHVFMEKPVAVDPVGVRRVIETGEKAREKGLGVMPGTQYRHQTSFIDTIRRIHDGEIGEVVGVHCHYNTGAVGAHHRGGEQGGLSELEHQIRNWYFYDWLSGDHIVEQHIHTIDAVNWVMQGHPLRAVGLGGRQVRVGPIFGNIYDHFAIDYEYANGVHVLSTCRQQPGTDGYVGALVFGTKGRAWVYEAEIEIYGGAKTKVGKFDIGKAYVQEHADLIQSIRAGKPENRAREVAESTLTAILGRESAYSGRKLTWEQMMDSELDLSPEKYEFGPHPVRPVAMPGTGGEQSRPFGTKKKKEPKKDTK